MIQLQVFSGDELVYSTKEIKSDGTGSMIEWHDVTMATTTNILRVDVVSNNEKIGSAKKNVSLKVKCDLMLLRLHPMANSTMLRPTIPSSARQPAQKDVGLKSTK